MKLFINRKIRRNPWGGGIHFASGLVDYLESTGHSATNSYDNDVDVILMMDPRDDEGFGDINHLLAYKQHLSKIGKKVKVVHRINDSDISRGTNFLVDLNISANLAIADKTVFISDWLKDHYESFGFNRNSVVIRNGTNTNFFFPQNKRIEGKIKVVTHHWSDNYNKGFDSYIALDEALQNRSDIEFTYVGRYYKGYTPKNTKIVSPLYGKELGDELRKHDVYLTAARWEACGMHHIEAAACGLPIAYHKDGGGINEMCKNYGIQFESPNDVVDVILNVASQKDELISKINYDALDRNHLCGDYVKYMLNDDVTR